jgi:hypothetical protein
MKISAFINTTKKNTDRQNRIRNSWAKGIDYLFVSDHEDFDTIKITENNGYESNEIKSISILNNIPYQYLENDFFLFCDDDTFVNAKFLKSELQNFKKNYIYGHVLNCWPPDTTLNFLSGGSGYLMSNEILIPIMGEIPLLGTGLNDVTFGEFIRQNKINIQHDDRFNPQTPAVMKKKDINKNFTFHYVNTDNLMYELYLKCI